jgi:hypothetical protein
MRYHCPGTVWEVILDLSGHPMTRGEALEPVVTLDSVPRPPR